MKSFPAWITTMTFLIAFLAVLPMALCESESEYDDLGASPLLGYLITYRGAATDRNKRRMSDLPLEADYAILRHILAELKDSNMGAHGGSPAKKISGIDLGMGGRSLSGSRIASTTAGKHRAGSAYAPGRKRRAVKHWSAR